MLTCGNCQFVNPADHKFCQRCGEPLSSQVAVATSPLLQVRVMPPGGFKLTPATYLASDAAKADAVQVSAAESGMDPAPTGHSWRYQVLTLLSQDRAHVSDTTPEVRTPIQHRLAQFTTPGSTPPSLDALKSTPNLPAAAYPYLFLSDAAPVLYDAWEWDGTALLVVAERTAVSSIVKAFSTAVDPLQHVYWMYRLTELWEALTPLPQWRSSLLLADNLGIDTDQSLRIQRFVPPATGEPAQLSDFKMFLQSLLAQPHRGAIASLRQIRQLILAVSSAKTLEQLSSELADIGKALLSTPAAITPAAVATSSVNAGGKAEVAIPTTTNSPTDSPTETAVTDSNLPADDFSALPVPITLPPNIHSSVAMTQSDAMTQSEDAPNDPLEAALEKDRLEDTVLQDISDSLDMSEGSDSTMVLPMKLVSLMDAGQTDVGRQRDHNEDCFFIARSSQKTSDNSGQSVAVHGLYILCDGMGGHDGGEVASQLAAQTLTEYFKAHWPAPLPGKAPAPLPDESTIVEAVKLANQAIYTVNEKENRAGHERMGTTLVVVLLQGTSAVVAHVGDSRLYKHSRRLGLMQMTTDHEVGQREIQRGIDPETAYARPDAYQLTQALGPRDSDDLEPSVSYLSFSEDTLLLLCSDGLSDNDLVEDYLDSHVDPLLRGKIELERGLEELVDLANEVNGHDNISAIAISLKVRPDMAQGAL
ncbi:MAG: serine/threonine phosphatase [Cyanobacteria bacterium P01_D01_bin.36]